MKKSVIALVLAVLVTGEAFADFSLSAGGGGYFTSAFGGGYEMSYMGMPLGIELPFMGSGIFAFIDATYVEASAGFFFGAIEVKGTGAAIGAINSVKIDFTSLTLGLLGKFPFRTGEKTALFPAVGIEYNAVLDAKLQDLSVLFDAGDLSHLWIKFGGGLDFSLTDRLYLRGTALYGIRFESKMEKDLVDLIKFSLAYEGVSGISVDTVLSHGIQLKFALGYKF